LDRRRETSRTLAMGQVDSAAAARLAAEGKAIVWIDGGLHATEVLGAQQLMETLWQVVSRDDPETLRILNDVVILFVHANPDGMDLVSDWYMRAENPQARTMAWLPRLYQKYIGHDNNRDFYASTQPETENMNRVMYRQWFPQIVYNHHQTGPTGTVMFAPPFRDPFNYQYDPLVITGIDMVGSSMHNRFVAENKPGVTTRRGANYSTWWNGGLRTTTYFHNMIGLLTETIGNPTPMEIPFVPNRQLPSSDLVHPIRPQTWRFRQSVDYSVTANYAVLDYASRYRTTLLTNFWRMGRNSVQRGRQDYWTTFPRYVDSVRAAIAAERQGQRTETNAVMSSGGLFGGAPNAEESARYLAMLRKPEWRDPRGYVIPSDQADFATATKFVNALLETGVTVHRATAPFTVRGKQYPAGSYVVRTDQAFRPHVLDMFEPQDHPNDFLYEGGPPIPPYDNAGWTLAYQMGIQFDRILEGFDAPVEAIDAWNLPAPRARHGALPRNAVAGWVVSPRQNDAFTLVNKLLARGTRVHRVTGGSVGGAGDFFIPAADGMTWQQLTAMADSLGVSVNVARSAPRETVPLRPLRIALWDRYGGSMPSGW
ncbi:MAG TPA: M14 family metallopeptidase, partial [Armatimonadota bacterium]|nr:M14 family metallopeptidase [Armatimonadota bacterium]